MSGWPQTRRTPARKPASRFRPVLENLEERDVPTTLTVTSPLDDGSAGTLRADIIAAQSGDTIQFASTLAGQTIGLDQGDLVINKNLTIQGLPNKPMLDGEGYSRVFTIEEGFTVSLSNLAIVDGGGGSSVVGGGGGILNEGTLTLSSCTVSGNHVQGGLGGGIENLGTLTLTAGCTVTNNGCADGGGIANFGTLTVDASSITGNSAETGGGIFNEGTATVQNSTLSGNYGYNGGGIFNYNHASLTVTGGSTVLNNTGTLGADIYNLGQEHISKDSTVGIKK
jgi:hypothetical protein